MAPKKSATKATAASPKVSKSKAVAKGGSQEADKPTATQDELKNAADSLMAALLSPTAPVSSVVDTIINMYREEDADKAMCAVVNAVCRASGVKEAEVDPATLRQEGIIMSTLEELFARVPQDSAAYLIVNKDPKYKRFKKNLPEFFERLVLTAYAGEILFDNVFFPTVLQWLIAMTESKARSFRHTSTVTILAVMKGLNDRIVAVKESILTLKKKDAAAAQKNLDNLMKLQEHIFTSAVHQRVKDVAPEIRLSIISALREWCIAAPEVYIVNKYLRYFSIAIYDKKPELRAEGLEALIQILGTHPESASKMRDFLKYFVERLVEMVGDVDTRCADLAIKVCALIARADTIAGETEETATLSNAMIDKILLSLFDDRGSIRSCAGTFLKIFIRSRISDEEESAEKIRTELLCTFASIFRQTYMEQFPEKYLVDALWKNDAPPSMLTEYKPLLTLAMKGEESEVVVALGIVAAMLVRLRTKEPLSFGPVAKDDGKVPPSKDTKDGFKPEELRVRISKDFGVSLGKIMEAHPDSADILYAVADVFAALDLHVFTTTKEGEKLRESFVTFRKHFASTPCNTTSTISRFVHAWQAIAFTEYPHQDAAESQLNELVKQLISQLQAADRAQSSSKSMSQTAKKSTDDLENVWGRLQVVTTIRSLKDQWILIKNSLKRSAHQSTIAPSLLMRLVAIASQSVLWQLAELEVDPSLHPDTVKDELVEILGPMFVVLGYSSEDSLEVLELRLVTLGFVNDLVALPLFAPSQAQQEQIVSVSQEVFDQVTEALKDRSDNLKHEVKQATGREANASTAVLVARREVSHWEAALARVAMGLVRLFAFQKVPEKLAPTVLLLWTRCSVKTVADIFKNLFHLMRDRSKDSLSLEKDILLAAYKQCSEQGANSAAVEALYQVGMKLSSMHFLTTDKYYAAGLAVVRWGVEFASTVDPTILNAISPYCCRLKQSDALSICNALSSHELFAECTSPYARAFLTAIRRGAKLEEPSAPVAAGSSATPWRSSKKRPREAAVAEQHDELLTEVMTSVKGSKNAQQAATVRRVTNDGWRVRGDAEVVSTQQSVGGKKSAKSPIGTQNSDAYSSALGDLTDEVFIATQEFE